MHLYTVILEYLGGSYMAQVHAESPENAANLWAKQLGGNRAIKGLDSGAISDITKELEEQDAVPIEGCVNAWCFDALVKDKLALIHVIATSSDP